jgi:hypothetical protein
MEVHMNGFAKKLEIVANVAIIVLAILLGGVIVKRYFLTPAPAESVAPAASSVPGAPEIKPGANVELANYNWSDSDNTLVMVLSTNCHFCTESGPFYKRLMEARSDKKKVRVAVFPQTPEEGRQYLAKFGVVADEIRTATPMSLGVRGTPTLILTDSKGAAVSTWVGKLPAPKEDEVLKIVHL